MSEQSQKLAPKLRFTEFENTDEWDVKRLDKVCEVLQGYGFPEAFQGKTNGKYPFCKVSDISRAVVENGGLLGEASNYIDEVELKQLRAKLIPIGATVFAKIGEALRLNRRAYVLKECLIDNNVTGLKAINGQSVDYFVYQLSQLIDLNKHCGGAVPSVNKTTLEEIKVIVPGLKEQQKIADCLSSLDDLINSQNQKVEALKQHKKGLMQQLFPAEGETVPQLRFPEFENDGEWKPKPLSEIVNPAIREVKKPEVNYLALGIRSHAKGTFHKPDQAPEKNSMEKLYLVNQDDLIVNITFAWEGAIAIAQKEDHGTYVSHRFPTYIFKEKICLSSFFQYVVINKSFIYKLGLISPGGAGRNRVMNKSDFLKITVLLPNTDEQKRVAECLTSLDDLIKIQTQKLESLKKHKTGLMQQLFPSINEVGK